MLLTAILASGRQKPGRRQVHCDEQRVWAVLKQHHRH